MKATASQKAMLVSILVILAAMSGAFLQNAETLSQCRDTGRVVYGSNTIMDCKVSEINEALNKNYWERK